MADPSVSSVDPTNISDFWSQTRSEGDDPANSPYAPKRPRLIPGGPPLELRNSSTGDMPGFVFEPRRLPRVRPGSPGDFSDGPSPVNPKDISAAPMPAPPAMTGRIPVIVRDLFPIVIAGIIAGVVTVSAAYLGATNGHAQPRMTGGPGLAAVEPQTTIPSPAAHGPQALPAEYQTAAIGTFVPPMREITAGEAVAPARAKEVLALASNEETVMLASRSEPQAEPVASPPRRLDPGYVQLLAKQGEQLVAAGDLAAARVVLERAASEGDDGAALALGGTYDPAVLRQIGALGIAADPGKARSWYEKAREFGSLEAARRLDRLATR
ncbi:MAG TPA: hypothetical protein VH684_24325 [Xanthobacteraceae bacterium]|jgi:hypothetical protein